MCTIKACLRCFFAIVISVTANLPILISRLQTPWLAVLSVIGFLVINIKPCPFGEKIKTRRLRCVRDGCELLKLFLISATISGLFQLAAIPVVFAQEKLLWFGNLAAVLLAEAVVFWNGIIRVYLSSVQLGIKWRVIGIVCGMIPIVHLIVLAKLIRLASEEAAFENSKLEINELRTNEQICDTRYPILMVHGVFFRDFRYLNYWGRIPKELVRNGARIYYGNHQSAASVADSGAELKARILEIIAQTGAEKLNVIAHSKGGLDMRYAVSKLGMDTYVASLTTINTPHRGCVFADYLLSRIPAALQQKVAAAYHAALKKAGDENPDFLAAVNDLTASACLAFNQEVLDMPGVYYQSIGSRLNRPSAGRFPLNFSYHLVKYFDGPNDGLVAESSFPWGADYRLLTVDGARGISHGDMIDLNRENIPGFDVREFYVSLVHKLKEKGF